jgi:predicted nucleic acid-binding protein
MRVLVDTPLWSLALRRGRLTREEQGLVDTLAALLRELEAVLIGPVRQEVLSGIPGEARYRRLREGLRALPDTPLVTADYEEAARLYNLCRRQGIQGSQVDFLICASALRLDTPIFTLDRDFDRYRKVVPVRLYAP